MGELAVLFAASFAAATLFPLPSEAALFAYLKLHPDQVAAAVAVATIGNTAGGMTSWLLGRFIPGKELKYSKTVQRYGAPVLLLAWLPLIGDALCVAAGWLRIRWTAALGFMAVGRLARYLLVAAAMGLDLSQTLLLVGGGTALFLLLGFAIALPAGLYQRHREKRLPKYVNRLTIDETGLTYAAYSTRSDNIAWDQIQRVVFYVGEPDVPDPMAGAQVREWTFVREPRHESLYVPDGAEHNAQLVVWCGRKLSGFSAEKAQQALSSPTEGHWLLWDRQGRST